MSAPTPDLEEIHRRVVFEVAGTNRPAQLSLEGPYGDAPDCFYLASLVYRHLSASYFVPGLDPTEFRAYFEELAEQRDGWDGVKRVSTGNGEFTIGSEYRGDFYTPEVWLDVRLATDSADPYWAVELRLELRPEALLDLAARARGFFTKPT